ncbi:TIGR01906 family membrane protein [Propionimicrobium sp. PCR01-08-3]|uniref:TIGR01906 family membrane protein n=1 Tax=Propionimicrobium sp. PCR01-08-3 TaxID=3052086 RepID=UPI00255C7681|nr:TIGR01906 family membrane protein [Propionimicrobium sp. PCR01-08-3]WIY81762.1 TIGR01906 family membrane protein [Propionimicrobium sp. PCR01-08-3]
MKRVASVLASIAVAGAILGNSVAVVLASTFSYRWFSAGAVNNYQLTNAEMQANYDRVVHFSLFPWVSELQLETLPMSDSGRQHFADAKDIFQVFVQGGLICLVVAVMIGIWLWRRHHASGFLTAGGILTLATPLVIATPLLIDFDKAFVAFHEIFFSNDLWIFDPKTDPIINYLPESLFMRNAFAILTVMIVLSVAAIICGRKARSRAKADRAAA